MTRMSDELFKQKLEEIKKIISLLGPELDLELDLTSDHDEIEEHYSVEELLAQFKNLINEINEFELDSVQKESLNAVIDVLPKDHLNSTANINPADNAHHLLAETLRAGVHFLTATLENRRELFAAFSQLERELIAATNVLPENEQQEIFETLNLLFSPVVRLSKDQLEAVKNLIHDVLHSTSQLTIGELVEAFDRNTDLLKLLGPEGVEAIEGLSGTEQLDDVTLSSLPPASQAKILSVLLATDPKIASGPLVQFAKGVHGLMAGAKTHLALVVTQADGHIQVVIVDLGELLKDAAEILISLVEELYQHGVRGGVVSYLCSPEEAAALLQLHGKTVSTKQSLAQITDDVLTNSTNPKELSRIVGEEISPEQIFAAIKMHQKHPTVYTAKEALDLAKILCAVKVIGDQLITGESLLPRVGGFRSIDGAKGTTFKIDLTSEMAHFDKLVAQLKEICGHLVCKSLSYSKYAKAVATAQSVIERLETAGASFFERPTANRFKLFQADCKQAIQDASDEFKNHRGWHQMNTVLKAILGILAGLSIIPMLIVEATTKDGFMGTFFATKPTYSASAFKGIPEDFQAQCDSIAAKLG